MMHGTTNVKSVLVLFSYLCQDLFVPGFQTKMLYAFLISVACPYNLTRLGFINVIFDEAYNKL
jgi:hypothetical protein